MKKFEKELFNDLSNELSFYIKEYYSNFFNSNKWIAILEKSDFIYAVVVADKNQCDYIYSEVQELLKKSYNKNIIVNVVITLNSDESYENYKYNHYNKVIYLIDKKQVVYSDEGCKPLVSVINYRNKKNEKKKSALKDNIVTYSLIAINILIFIITTLISQSIFDIDINTLELMGAKVNNLINYGQVWRLITCAFLHGGLAHIAFNMYALKIIGSEVEFSYGKKKYIFIYLFSALGGSLFSYIFSPNSVSVGASGAIFGLFGAMLVFGFKNRKRIGKAYMMSLVKVVLINIFIGITISNIDNSAHIGGLLFGAILALIVRDNKIYE